MGIGVIVGMGETVGDGETVGEGEGDGVGVGVGLKDRLSLPVPVVASFVWTVSVGLPSVRVVRSNPSSVKRTLDQRPPW